MSDEVTELERSNPYNREGYKAYWAQAALVKEAMKKATLFKEDRDELWSRYRKMSDYVYTREQSEYEAFKNRSESHKNTIVDKAYYCNPYHDGGVIGNMLPGNCRDSFSDLKSLSDSLKDVRDLFADWKDEMSKKDKGLCWEAIKDAQDGLDTAFSELRKINDRNREIRAEKHAEWRERTQARIRENTEKLRKANDTLERVQDNISKLEDNIASAWSDDFRDRAGGWLSEAESKASDIEAWIEKLESWIQEDEDKLND